MASVPLTFPLHLTYTLDHEQVQKRCGSGGREDFRIEPMPDLREVAEVRLDREVCVVRADALAGALR